MLLRTGILQKTVVTCVPVFRDSFSFSGRICNNNNNNNNNLYFKRVTPITIKSILPSGPLKTKLIIINYNSHDKKPIYK